MEMPLFCSAKSPLYKIPAPMVSMDMHRREAAQIVGPVPGRKLSSQVQAISLALFYFLH